MENIGTGLMLMVVGMATVFVILLIVIWLSQFLIKVVNKIAPEEEVKKKPAASGPSTDAGAMDAIKSAVNILTAGKGQSYQDREIITILKIRKTHYLLQWKKK